MPKRGDNGALSACQAHIPLLLPLQVSHEHIVHHQKSAGNYANSIPALDKQAGTYIGSDTRCFRRS